MDDHPFLGAQALRAGRVTDHGLRTRFRAVYRNVYLGRDVEMTALRRAAAAALWAGPDAVLVGTSAAAVWGTKWLNANSPAEVVRPDRHSPPGIVVRSFALAADDVVVRAGLRITTAARTAFDIARLTPQADAVPVLDALLRATRISGADVLGLIAGHPATRGVRRAEATLALVDGGAESPQESRVRLMLIKAGLPVPETQIEFFDEYGAAFIRSDMGWRSWKVLVEYDGVQHWSDSRQRAWDIERAAVLESMGWAVIRVSAAMLRRPEVFIERVRVKLRERGCPL
ncbi:DUF559 domain-containing protein [Mycobacterium sp. MBM]|nr:DUF559 domain-containing protein [Mycobacterium sp. MBM]